MSGDVRQVKRQLEMFLEDGERTRITVALALLDSLDRAVEEKPLWESGLTYPRPGKDTDR